MNRKSCRLQRASVLPQSGKALVGNLAGIWRYRVGDNRILCSIKDDALEILVVEIAHRRNVYDSE